MLIVLVLSMLLGAAGQESATTAADVTLVVEPGRGGNLEFTCNGKKIAPKELESGLYAVLRHSDRETRRMLILFDDAVTLDKMFEIASFVEGPVGVKGVRHFVFSRKTRVMQEIKPLWERWKLSFDGKLEKAPWVSQ